MTGRRFSLDRTQLAVLLAVVVGLGLRIAEARGGLWLDEAWSAVYAARARTPLGVFIAINHDNNHHLNSLWLQAIGLGAPPWLARLPSIIAGTASILIAAAIGARRNAASAMIAAILFAISPIMVEYGAEARGYGTMILAFLALILVVDRAARPPRLKTGVLAAFGMLSQLTMVFGIAAVSGWVLARLFAAGWRRKAIERTFDAMAPAAAAALLMFAIVLGAAAASSTGMQVGSYEPFTLERLLQGLRALTMDTIGIAAPSGWLDAALALLLTLAAVSLPALRPRAALYLLAIVGLPLMIALLKVPNTGYARYFLIGGVSMLLLIADAAGTMWTVASVSARAVIIVVMVAVIAASLARDSQFLAADRAHPAAPVAAMRALAPHGTTVLLDNERSSAVLDVAAASARYPLVIRQACPAAPFLLLDASNDTILPDHVRRCAADYRLILTGRPRGLPYMSWALYRRQGGKD